MGSRWGSNSAKDTLSSVAGPGGTRSLGSVQPSHGPPPRQVPSNLDLIAMRLRESGFPPEPTTRVSWQTPRSCYEYSIARPLSFFASGRPFDRRHKVCTLIRTATHYTGTDIVHLPFWHTQRHCPMEDNHLPAGIHLQLVERRCCSKDKARPLLSRRMRY